MGYHRAGFDVVGVDIDPHPDYPFRLIVADALAILAEADFGGFAVVHASPPCQGRTTMSNRHRGKGGLADSHDNLVPEVRHYLERWGGVYVIENVPGARRDMAHPITLHGGMFGLRVHRTRLFDSNLPLRVSTAPKVVDPIGVYGKAHDGRRLFTRADGSIQRAARTLEEAREAMGIDWMQWRDLAEAIPPAYTEFIGRQLIDQLEAAA